MIVGEGLVPSRLYRSKRGFLRPTSGHRHSEPTGEESPAKPTREAGLLVAERALPTETRRSRLMPDIAALVVNGRFARGFLAAARNDGWVAVTAGAGTDAVRVGKDAVRAGTCGRSGSNEE